MSVYDKSVEVVVSSSCGLLGEVVQVEAYLVAVTALQPALQVFHDELSRAVNARREQVPCQRGEVRPA